MRNKLVEESCFIDDSVTFWTNINHNDDYSNY